MIEEILKEGHFQVFLHIPPGGSAGVALLPTPPFIPSPDVYVRFWDFQAAADQPILLGVYRGPADVPWIPSLRLIHADSYHTATWRPTKMEVRYWIEPLVVIMRVFNVGVGWAHTYLNWHYGWIEREIFEKWEAKFKEWWRIA